MAVGDAHAGQGLDRVEERTRREHRVDARALLVPGDHPVADPQHRTAGRQPARCLGRGSRAPAHLEDRPVGERMRRRRARHRIPQPPPRLGAELDARHGHGRQRGGGEPREGDVVDAGDGDLPGHVDAELAEACQQAERDEVVEGDDRGGARRQHVLGGAISVLHLRPARDVEHLDSGVPGDELGEPAATEPVGVGLRRAGEVGDARVAERHEMLAERADRVLVVDRRAPPPGRSRRGRFTTTIGPERASRASSRSAGMRGETSTSASHLERASTRDLLLVGHALRPCRRRARGSRRGRPRDVSPLSTPWNIGFSRSGTTRATVLLRPRTRLRAVWLGE